MKYYIHCLTAIIAFTGFTFCTRAMAIDVLPTGAIGSHPVDGLVDDSADGWIWSRMSTYDDPALVGGDGHCGGPGAYGAYTFTGTGVQVVGFAGPLVSVDGRSHKMGHARVSIDGAVVTEVSMVKPVDEYGVTMANVTGLKNAVHVLQIEPEAGWILVDYIKIITVPVQQVDAEDSAPTKTAHIVSLIPEGTYRFYPQHDLTKCLTVRDEPVVDGTPVVSFHGISGGSQVWKLIPLGNERYRLSPVDAPAQALAIFQNGATPDYVTGTWTYHDLPADQWYISAIDRTYYRISSVLDSKRSLDVSDVSMQDNAAVLAYSWNGGANQRWALQAVSPSK